VNDPRRDLPSVNTLLETDRVRELLGAHPRSAVLDAVRRSIETARNIGGAQYSVSEWIDRVEAALHQSEQPLWTQFARPPRAIRISSTISTPAVGAAAIHIVWSCFARSPEQKTLWW
jgi:hypothetical protein